MEVRENNGPYNIYAETEIIVEFYQVDPMNIVWHGNYINYFEAGRRALLEKIRYDYIDMKESNYYFPVVDVKVKYLGSLHFNERARIKAILMEYENCLRIKYEIRNAKTGILTTRGVSTQMAFNIKTNESCFVCPKIFTDRVEALIGGMGQ